MTAAHPASLPGMWYPSERRGPDPSRMGSSREVGSEAAIGALGHQQARVSSGSGSHPLMTSDPAATDRASWPHISVDIPGPSLSKRRSVRVAAFSDTHLAASGAPPASWHNQLEFATARDRLRLAIAESGAENADFLVITGDLANAGDQVHLNQVFDDLTHGAPMRAFVVPGNHDVLERPDAAQRALTSRHSNVSIATPAWMEAAPSVSLAGALIRKEGSEHWVEPPKPFSGAHTSLAIWLSHFPVYSRAAEFADRDLAYAGDAAGSENVARGLSDLPVPVVVLSGHLHARASLIRERLVEINLAALIEPPFDLAILDIDMGPEVVTVVVSRRSLIPSTVRKLPVLCASKQEFTWSRGAWEARDLV
jgi:calcineurin-like phosphoesterase family protein